MKEHLKKIKETIDVERGYSLGTVFTTRNKQYEYYGAAEPPVRCGESHLSGLTEPPHFIY